MFLPLCFARRGAALAFAAAIVRRTLLAMGANQRCGRAFYLRVTDEQARALPAKTMSRPRRNWATRYLAGSMTTTATSVPRRTARSGKARGAGCGTSPITPAGYSDGTVALYEVVDGKAQPALALPRRLHLQAKGA